MILQVTYTRPETLNPQPCPQPARETSVWKVAKDPTPLCHDDIVDETCELTPGEQLGVLVRPLPPVIRIMVGILI